MQSQTPAFKATKVVWLPKGHQQPKGTVRVHNSRIDAKKENPRKFRRHQAVVLTNSRDKAKVVLGVVGTPDDINIPRNAIGLNYEAMDVLRVHADEEIEVEVRPASFFELYASIWSHPDPIVRISLWFGVIGTVTGIAGMFV